MEIQNSVLAFIDRIQTGNDIKTVKMWSNHKNRDLTVVLSDCQQEYKGFVVAVSLHCLDSFGRHVIER